MRKGKILFVLCFLLVFVTLFAACTQGKPGNNDNTTPGEPSGPTETVKDLKYFYNTNLSNILGDDKISEELKNDYKDLSIFTKEELIENKDLIDSNSLSIYELLSSFAYDVQSVWKKNNGATVQADSSKYEFQPQMLQSTHATDLNTHIQSEVETKNYDQYVSGEMVFLNIDETAFKLVDKITTTKDGLVLDTDNKILFSGEDASGKVVVPDTIERIQKGAFENNKNVTEVFIPKTVKVVEKNAFTGCDNLQIKTDADKKPESWDDNFADNNSDITYDPPQQHTHEFGEWIVDSEPTCTKDGSKHRVCSCGEKETAVIDKLGHDWETEWTIDKEASCTETGSKSHHCKRCNEKKDVTAIDKLEHTKATAVKENIVAATCTQDGSYDEVVYCSVCGAEISRTKKTILKLGHDWETEWTIDKEATETEEGSKSHHCKRCDEKKDVTVIDKITNPTPGPDEQCQHEFAPFYEINENGVGDHLELEVCNKCNRLHVIKHKGNESDKKKLFYDGNDPLKEIDVIRQRITSMDFLDISVTTSTGAINFLLQNNIYYEKESMGKDSVSYLVFFDKNGTCNLSYMNDNFAQFSYTSNITTLDDVFCGIHEETAFADVFKNINKYNGKDYEGSYLVSKGNGNNDRYDFTMTISQTEISYTLTKTTFDGIVDERVVTIKNLNVYNNIPIPEYADLYNGGGTQPDIPQCDHEFMASSEEFFMQGVGDYFEYRKCKKCNFLTIVQTNGSESAKPKSFIENGEVNKDSLSLVNKLLMDADYVKLSINLVEGSQELYIQPNAYVFSYQFDQYSARQWTINSETYPITIISESEYYFYNCLIPSTQKTGKDVFFMQSYMKEFEKNAKFDPETKTFSGTFIVQDGNGGELSSFSVVITDKEITIHTEPVNNPDKVFADMTISMLNVYQSLDVPSEVYYTNDGSEDMITHHNPGYDDYHCILNRDEGSLVIEVVQAADTNTNDTNFKDGMKDSNDLPSHVNSEMLNAQSFMIVSSLFKGQTSMVVDKFIYMPTLLHLEHTDKIYPDSNLTRTVIDFGSNNIILDQVTGQFNVDAPTNSLRDSMIEYTESMSLMLEKAVFDGSNYTSTVNYNQMVYKVTSMTITESQVVVTGNVEGSLIDCNRFEFVLSMLNSTLMPIQFLESYNDGPNGPDGPGGGGEQPEINLVRNELVEIRLMCSPIDLTSVTVSYEDVVAKKGKDYEQVMTLLNDVQCDSSKPLSIININLMKDNALYVPQCDEYRINIRNTNGFDGAVIIYRIDLENNTSSVCDNAHLDQYMISFDSTSIGYFVICQSPEIFSLDLRDKVKQGFEVNSYLQGFAGPSNYYICDFGKTKPYGIDEHLQDIININNQYYNGVTLEGFNAIFKYDQNKYELYDLNNCSYVTYSEQSKFYYFGEYLLVKKGYYEIVKAQLEKDPRYQESPISSLEVITCLDQQYNKFINQGYLSNKLYKIKFTRQDSIMRICSTVIKDQAHFDSLLTTEAQYGAVGTHSKGVYAIPYRTYGIIVLNNEVQNPEQMRALGVKDGQSVDPDGRITVNCFGYNVNVPKFEDTSKNEYIFGYLNCEALFTQNNKVDKFVVFHSDNKEENFTYNCHRAFYYFTLNYDGVDYDFCIYVDLFDPKDDKSELFKTNCEPGYEQEYESYYFGFDANNNKAYLKFFIDDNKLPIYQG